MARKNLLLAVSVGIGLTAASVTLGHAAETDLPTERTQAAAQPRAGAADPLISSARIQKQLKMALGAKFGGAWVTDGLEGRRRHHRRRDQGGRRPAQGGEVQRTHPSQTERALDRGFDGVALLTGYRGRSLADTQWTELFSLPHDREAVVHVHPTVPHPWPADADTRPSLLEYPFETTRVFVGMARKRVFNRFPGNRWIFWHGGGTVPFLSDRITGGSADDAIDGGDTLAHALAVSRFDTALCGAPALAVLTEFTCRDRMLFGSDLPFVSPGRASRFRRHCLRWTASARR